MAEKLAYMYHTQCEYCTGFGHPSKKCPTRRTVEQFAKGGGNLTKLSNIVRKEFEVPCIREGGPMGFY